jgi:hypothetical protein
MLAGLEWLLEWLWQLGLGTIAEQVVPLVVKTVNKFW